MSTDNDERALPSSPAEIEAVIAERRTHLAATVDELIVRAQPREIARRSARDAKRGLTSAIRTEDGELRTERIAAIGGAALAVVLTLALLRWRRGRAR